MERINHLTAEADKFGAGKPGFSGGDPEAEVPATIVTPTWLDHVQEELANAIEVFGPLDPAQRNQLAAGLMPLVTPIVTTRSLQLRACPLVHEPMIGSTADVSYWQIQRWKYDYPQGFSQGRLFLDLSPLLEPRSALSKVSFRVITHARSGTERMRFQLYRQSLALNPIPFDPNMVRTYSLGSAYAEEGTGGEQLIELVPSSSNSTIYAVVQACGSTPPAGDALLSVSVEYTRTGI